MYSDCRSRNAWLRAGAAALGFLAGALLAQDEPTEAEVEFGKAWIAGLREASPTEDILLGAMLAEEVEPSAVPGLLRFEFAAPDHDKLRLSLAWYHCRRNPAQEFCQDNSFADQLRALDPDNLEPHLYAALDLLDAGQDEAALAALVAGVRTMQADTYYLDKLALIRERLASTAYAEGRINWAAETFSGALDTYLLYARLLAACASRSQADARWSEQCFAVGSKLETAGNTVVQNVHGFAMQRDALAGDDPARAEIVARMAAFNRIRDLGSEKLDWWADVSRKPDLVYDETRAFGEFEAIERALQRHDAGG